MSGDFGFETELVIQNITILGTSQSVQGPVALTKGWEHNFGTGAGMPQFNGGAAESRRGAATVWGLVAGIVSVWSSL